MPTGTIVDITSSRMSPVAERSLQVWGTEGCVSTNLQTRNVQHWKATGAFANNPQLVHAIAANTPDPRTLKDRVFGEWIQAEQIQADDADAMSLELREFISCIRTGESPQVSGTEAVNAMIVADQVLEALRVWSYQTNAMNETAKKKAA